MSTPTRWRDTTAALWRLSANYAALSAELLMAYSSATGSSSRLCLPQQRSWRSDRRIWLRPWVVDDSRATGCYRDRGTCHASLRERRPFQERPDPAPCAALRARSDPSTALGSTVGAPPKAESTTPSTCPGGLLPVPWTPIHAVTGGVHESDVWHNRSANPCWYLLAPEVGRVRPVKLEFAARALVPCWRASREHAQRHLGRSLDKTGRRHRWQETHACAEFFTPCRCNMSRAQLTSRSWKVTIA